MSVLEAIGWILGGVLLINIFVIIATYFLSKIEKKSKTEGVLLLGKLSNSDASIHDAVKYLKLTNGIGDE